MFARSNPTLEFADTCAAFDPRPAALPDDYDPVEQMRLSEQADLMLLRLVVCAAMATLLLALAARLGV